MENTYRVYTLKLAEHLTAKGHKIIKVVQDIKKPNFMNWLFENTPALVEDIEKYQKSLKLTKI